MAARSRIDWRKCAAQLGAALPCERLHPAVVAWTREHERSRRPWVIAFSGGADSLALLMLVWSHWPERQKKLCAVHFNHRMRGASANRDERFCRTVCAALGVRFISGEWKDVPRKPSEAQAREARHAFFSQQLRRWRACALWLGHQQDDIAETMLMRLARGSGLGGLAAPRPVHVLPGGRVHLRPLLHFRKAELVEYLRQCGARWCEDASNAAGDFLRNRIRREVLPVWRSVNSPRDALAGISLSRELIEEDDYALDRWLAEVDPITKNGALSLRRLAGKPRGLVRRALHQWFLQQKRGGNLSRQAFTAMLDDLVRGRVTRHSVDRIHLLEIGKRFAKIVGARRKISK